ncbi:hypothetical protein ACHAXR_007726, partial [Thalassiosira sp. AJA248-18]
MAYSAYYFGVAVLLFISMSTWITNIHAAQTPISGESYLYNTEDSSPVLDHGLSGNDFSKSTSPKVVEFYDPRCGACQAFKSNYIEVAKKVQAQKPNVEFYGVSCEAYPFICEANGGTRVPRIYAFPSVDAGGIEVPKGAGTIYFLSSRLMKALRSPEEIAADGEKLAVDIEATKRNLMGKDDSADGESGEANGLSDLTNELSEDEDSGSEDGSAGEDELSEDEDEDQDESEDS